MSAIAAFIGRIFIAALFVYSGGLKLFNPAPVDAMITSVGLPAGLAIPVGIFELVAGLCLALGFMTRFAAILLAGFTAATILFYHNDFGTIQGMTAALMHLALVGGLLGIFAHSQMRWSYDSMRLTRKAEIARRDADAQVHEAELRAAKAEAHSEGMRAAPVAAPLATAPVIDRDRDGVDDREQVAPARSARIDTDRDGIDDRDQAAPVRRTKIDTDRDGVDDRDEPIDPRIRP